MMLSTDLQIYVMFSFFINFVHFNFNNILKSLSNETFTMLCDFLSSSFFVAHLC